MNHVFFPLSLLMSNDLSFFCSSRQIDMTVVRSKLISIQVSFFLVDRDAFINLALFLLGKMHSLKRLWCLIQKVVTMNNGRTF